MANPKVGFQPRNTPAERRAFYDQQRQIAKAIAAAEEGSDGITQAAADARYVNTGGDTMTGGLHVVAAGNFHSLRCQNTNNTPFVEFRSNEATPTRYGYVQGGTTQVLMQADVGDVRVRSVTAKTHVQAATGIEMHMGDVAGNFVKGWAGLNTSFILPRGSNATDVEGLLQGKGFRVELGLEPDQRLRVTCFGEDRAWIDNGGDADFVGNVTTGTLKAGGGWKAWTPLLTGWGLSNGTLTGSYSEINDTVFFRFKLTIGSSTTKVGTPIIGGFPVAVHADFFDSHFNLAMYQTTQNSVGVGKFANSSQAQLDALATETGTNPVNVGNGGVTSAVPITWATGHYIVGTGFYRKA